MTISVLGLSSFCCNFRRKSISAAAFRGVVPSIQSMNRFSWTLWVTAWKYLWGNTLIQSQSKMEKKTSCKIKIASCMHLIHTNIYTSPKHSWAIRGPWSSIPCSANTLQNLITGRSTTTCNHPAMQGICRHSVTIKHWVFWDNYLVRCNRYI